MINFIFNNYRDDKYNYILILHIKRYFNSTKSEKVYSLIFINPYINQLFIDNLNAKNISLKDLLQKDIKHILDDNGKYMDLKKEFKKALKSFLNKELIGKIKIDSKNMSLNTPFIFEGNLISKNYNYIDEMIEYMDKEDSFKEKIFDKAKQLIDMEEGNCKDLIKKIFNNNYINNYINRNSLDIISIILDYIKDQIFVKYLKHIFKVLEDNNILTTLLEIHKNNNSLLNNSILEQLKGHFLEIITMEKIKYEPKFLFNYNIPGFFNFYKNLSNFIKENITIEYFNNETRIRELFKGNIEKEINNFHEKEEYLLSYVYDEIGKDIFISNIINQISTDLILKDYINYFCHKYININIKDDISHKLIKLLLKLRFNEEHKIIKYNKNNDIKILLIKLIWIESNINYISQIVRIFEHAIDIFYGNGNKIYNMIEKIISNEDRKIRYITNEKRNPKHTKEVNECYYIFLAALCLCITSDEIKLVESIDLEKKNNEVEINYYCSKLKEIYSILKNLNDDSFTFLNEIYIIEELIRIIELVKKKKLSLKK